VADEGRGETVVPGALSALLADLVRAPGVEGPLPLRPGDLLGRFEIVRELGRGGFGVVYEARDRELGRAVAVKVVRVGERTGLREERLLAEAETAARLTHPNIVTLHDVGRSERGPYLVLELLRGRSLTARLTDGPMTPGEAVHLAIEVARGLAAAHAAGVAHRDLTPNNVFLCDDGQVKILDLGLAHAFGRRKADGGTPTWMAPEQARGAPEDERTDIFALGLILYRLLAGSPAFPSDDDGKALTSARPAPALEVPAAPELGPLLARLLAKDPVARPRDGAEVVAALAPIERELHRGEAPAGPVRVRRRPRLRLAAIIAVGAMLGALAALYLPRAWRTGSLTGAAARVTIAVADIVNQTGDPELDFLSGLLVTSLEQSRKLSVLTHTRMVDLLTRPGEPRPRVIDERLAREAGRGAGARAVLLPVIHRIGSIFAVELRAIDPATEESLFSISERATSKEAIFELIDRLSARARRDLHEEEQSIEADHVDVARAASGSLEAYRHYVLAMQALEDHDFARSLAEAKQALEIEPTMALAHAWIAWMAGYNIAGGEDGEAHMKVALANTAGLPVKERRFVEALGQGGAALRQLAEDYPKEKYFWFFAGVEAEPPASGRPFQLKALALDPGFPWPLYEYMMRGGDPAVFLPMARRAVELRPDLKTLFNLSLALGYTGNSKEGLEVARQARGLARPPRAELDCNLASQLMALGRLREAAAQLEPWLRPGVDDSNRHMALVCLAQVEARQGRRRAALRSYAEDQRILKDNAILGYEGLYAGIGGDEAAVQRSLLAVKDPPPWLSTAFIEHGLLDEGKALADRLAEDNWRRKPARALVEWRSGRADAAIPLFSAFLDSEDSRNTAEAWLLGRMLADAGRCREAIVEFDRLPAMFPWFVAHGPELGVRMPLSLLEGARCHLALGQSGLARERLDRLLALWEDADADLPALAEARAMHAKLGPVPARSP